jgi:hypothetical protein
MTTSDDQSSTEPDRNPADERVKRIRQRTMDLLANAAVHVQRIEDGARKLGLTAEIVDGVGDHLYEVVIAQLDLASKIVERSQALADRLLELGTTKGGSLPLLRMEAMVGSFARHFFVITNDSMQTATVEVSIDSSLLVGQEKDSRVGRRMLPAGNETGVEVEICTQGLDPKNVYPGSIHVTLHLEDGGIRAFPPRNFELWLRDEPR